MAQLEEFIQEKYVENYDNNVDDKNKVESIRKKYPNYFYDPSLDGFGTCRYVVDSKGHALYLIDKSELPEEIKKVLVGGDTGEGKYTDYKSLNDVYGVTFDLKVYYCSEDGKLVGISMDELDMDDLTRTVLDSSSELAKALSKREDKTLNGNDIQGLKNVTLDSNVTSLNDLYALTSLESLTLQNLNLASLSGMENTIGLSQVYFKNCVVEDYSMLSELGDSLTFLYFYEFDDTEFEKLCNGISNASFPNLTYFSIVGVEKTNIAMDNLGDIWNGQTISNVRTAKKFITNLLPFSKLGEETVGNVHFLHLESNYIGDTGDGSNTIYALENISGFTGVEFFRIERNNLTTLKGIEKCKNLGCLFASYNNLGKNEVYNDVGTTDEEKGKNSTTDALSGLSKNEKISYIHLRGNLELKWVGYLSGLNTIRRLYFGDGTEATDCIKMIDTEVSKLRKIFSLCENYKSYPSKYWLSLLDSEDSNLEIQVEDQTITKLQFETLGNYKNCKTLNLKNIKIKESDENSSLIANDETSINTLVNDVLKSMKGLKYVSFESKTGTSLENLSSIEFLKGIDTFSNKDDIDLIELVTLGTKISTRKSETEKYANGLMLLQTKREGLNTYYCPSLRHLAITGIYTKLVDIGERIATLVSLNEGSYLLGNSRSGFWSDNKAVIESLSGVSSLNIVYLRRTFK